ncbi:MAG: hypothetical protein H7A23_13820 [Leptospiraceae bacterium]|nr:hypothetical protein [Leptospiraceae bacterium]MCP5495627.1 hypothetical protein [Leptospiraceae bacterium]
MKSKFQFTLEPRASQKFGPFKITRQIGGGLEEFSGKDIQFFHTKASLKLKKGTYKLPITKDNHLLVTIQPDTTCNLFISTSQIEQKKEVNAVINDFVLEFSKPIILDKVLPILASLPEIFDDKNIETVKKFLQVIGREDILKSFNHLGKDLTKRIEDTFTFLSSIESFIAGNLKGLQLKTKEKELKAKLEETPETAIMPLVYLEKVKGRPIQKRKFWNLDLSFSGKVYYLDSPVRTFQDIKLPYMLIPALHADLENLLSHKPLSSARLKADFLDIEGLAREFFRFTESFSGEFRLEGFIPKAIVKAVIHDHSVIGMKLFNTEPHLLTGEFSGKISHSEMSLNVEKLRIQGKTTDIFCKMNSKLSYYGKQNHLPIECLLELLQGKTWEEVEASSEIRVELLEKSCLDNWAVSLNVSHPELYGTIETELSFSKLFFIGHAKLSSEPESNRLQLSHSHLEFSGKYKAEKAELLEQRQAIKAKLENGLIEGKMQFRSGRLLKLDFAGSVDVSAIGSSKHPEIPELDIKKDTLQTQLAGTFHYHLQTLLNFDNHDFMKGNIKNSSFRFESKSVDVKLNQYHIEFPAQVSLLARVLEGKLDSTGLGNLNMELHWDLFSQIPILHKGKESIKLFYKPPKKGKVNLLIAPGGKLDIRSESKGMFGGQIFSAILHPEAKLDSWLDTLENPLVGKHISKLAKFFSQKTGDFVYELRKNATLLRKVFKREKIEQLGDVVPYKKFVKVFVRFSGRKDLEEDFKVLLKQLLAGRGLSKTLTKDIAKKLLKDKYAVYKVEIQKLISILATLVNPLLINRNERKKKFIPSKTFDFSLYLTANQIYETLEENKWTEEFHLQLENIAHYMRIAQLEWILKQNPYQTSQKKSQHLQNVFNLKQRIHLAREQFGGLAYLPQEIYINFFLSDLTEILSSQNQEHGSNLGFIQKGYLGPSETAILLQAILSSPFQGRNVQLNMKYLFDLIRKKNENFFLYTLIELSDDSIKVLTQFLYRLFNFRQDMLKEEIDFRDFFEKQLNLKVPQIKEIEKTSNQSYYQELSKVAAKILKNREEYDLLKNHLQTYKQSKTTIALLETHKKLAAEAKECIEMADKEKISTVLYERAFAKCSKYLSVNPAGFQEDWFKKFWHRNHEALVVLSVVRNYQNNIDNVRNWLHVKSGKTSFSTELSLLETVVDTLYKKSGDKEIVKNDPLVRLLIDPPKGKYDFSIVSCMGIITYGSKGTELDKTFERLKKLRGIETIRSNTKIMRSLRSNARWVEKAIQTVKTPFGLLGYSQGCANALTAEDLMIGGTPVQRKKIELLKTRNFLYGAANGSVHGDTANLKYFRFAKQIELLVRDYKKNLSPYFQELLFEVISLVVASRRLVHITGGMSSVSSKASLNLAIYGQFGSDIPSSSVRGVVDKSTLPEANEMLSNLLAIQSGNKNHDTQVEVQDAVPYFTHLDTDVSKMLKKNDMGSFIQATHHWAPLLEEVEFLTTERDRELAIYDTPKDRHVFPWIEVNARFGIIKKKG